METNRHSRLFYAGQAARFPFEYLSFGASLRQFYRIVPVSCNLVTREAIVAIYETIFPIPTMIVIFIYNEYSYIINVDQ